MSGLARCFAKNDFSQKIAGATFADNDVRSRTVSRLFRRSLRQNSAQLPTKGELLLIAPLTFRVAYIQLLVRVLALDAAVIRGKHACDDCRLSAACYSYV